MSISRHHVHDDHAADGSDEITVVGPAGAAGRDQYVGAQIVKAETVARGVASTTYDGELYRSTSP